MVHNAIGVNPTAGSEQGLVTLEEAVFHSVNEAPVDGLVQMQEQFMQWYEVGRNFLALIIAIVMFVIFLRMVKRHKPGAEELEILAEGGPNGMQKAAEMPSFLTPEMLNELIQEKPENVSTALKNWATNGPS